MSEGAKQQDRAPAAVAGLVGRRAENVFEARGFCCSESVLWVMNQAFHGGVEPAAVLQLASGFCHGMGGADSICGALAGGQMGVGLFLGPHGPGGLKKKEFQKIAKALHDRFKEEFGETCCRVLLERRKEKKRAGCRELTGTAARLAAELLLAQRPELAVAADQDFLRARDSKAASLLRKALGRRATVG